MTATSSIKHITIVGTGVIGNGWITRFLANGCHVTASDPDSQAEVRTREAVQHAWDYAEELGLAEGASPDNLVFEPDLEKALAGAEFIQENVSEREPLKRSVIASIDQYAPNEAIIASSTSGILPSTLQAVCTRHSERVIVAHPFNPVYLSTGSICR